MSIQPPFQLLVTAVKTPTTLAKVGRGIFLLSLPTMLIQFFTQNFWMFSWALAVREISVAIVFIIMFGPLTLFLLSLALVEFERKRYTINLAFSSTEIIATHVYQGRQLLEERFPMSQVKSVKIENTKNWRRRDFVSYHLWSYYHFTRFSFVQIIKTDGTSVEYRIPGLYDHKLINPALENIKSLGYQTESAKTGYNWWQYGLYRFVISAIFIITLLVVGTLFFMFASENTIQHTMDYIDNF